VPDCIVNNPCGKEGKSGILRIDAIALWGNAPLDPISANKAAEKQRKRVELVEKFIEKLHEEAPGFIFEKQPIKVVWANALGKPCGLGASVIMVVIPTPTRNVL